MSVLIAPGTPISDITSSSGPSGARSSMVLLFRSAVSRSSDARGVDFSFGMENLPIGV